jgi:S-adenosylmethionine/arginine decarboxylase-like enzyme
MSNYWGYHLMLDFAGCNDSIKDRDTIYKFIKELVVEIDMTAHGEPIIEYLLPGDPKQGYSLMQLITTSNICAHFVEPDSTAYFDVFSCKEFDNDTVLNVIDKYFSPTKTKINFLTRQAG